MMCSLIFNFLETKDFNVIRAKDGFSGLHLAKELQPDLIICDINIANLNGFEVFKALRQDLKTAKIPVIFLISETGLDCRSQAMALGANDYLEKPVYINKLMESIVNQFQIAGEKK